MEAKPKRRGTLGWRRRFRRGAVCTGLLAAVALALALALAGCGNGVSRLAVAPPPDPPPIPLRKPPMPPGSPPTLAASSVPVPTAPVWRPKAKPLPATATPSSVTWAPLEGTSNKTAPEIGRPVTTIAATRASEATAPYAYIVQPGDTVYGISRKLGVPLRDVMDANALTPPYTLSVNQTLRIPNPRRHTVKRGDTVYGISRSYGVEMSELVRLNGIASPYTISPGAMVVLPAAPGAAPQRAAIASSEGALGEPPEKLAPAAKTKPGAVQQAAVTPAAKPGRLAAIPKPPPRAGGKFLWPAVGKLLVGYGPKKGGLHNDGINIAAPRGTPVRAAENGVVVYSGNELRGFGNLILIKHADGWVTAYAHTDQILISRGQRVGRGQKIASVGSTGNVSTPQLHFEIRKGSRAVDPRRHLGPMRASAGSVPPA